MGVVGSVTSAAADALIFRLVTGRFEGAVALGIATCATGVVATALGASVDGS